MRATSYNRRSNTNRDTYLVLEKLIGMIPCQFIDEVKSENVRVLAGLLKAQGLSPASVLSYLSLMKTFFNWLIGDAEVLEGRNPVNKVKKPPRSSKVRDFLFDQQTVQKRNVFDTFFGWTFLTRFCSFLYCFPLLSYVIAHRFRYFFCVHGDWHWEHKTVQKRP